VSRRSHRSRAIANQVIGLSISYDREHLLARGLGLEHLRELLIGLARPVVRQGASLAYAGHWRDTEDNFTYELLRLISAEQEDNSLGGPDSNRVIGRLYNHSSWPHYLTIAPGTEARWVNCCRIVRISQADAGLATVDVVPDTDAEAESDRVWFNQAVTLSAMRRLAMEGTSIDIPDVPSPEPVPAIVARVALGGRMTSFTGFLPGIFEESLLALEYDRPLYLLGGFGGAAEVLARALLSPAESLAPALTLAWQCDQNRSVARLHELSQGFALPAGVRTTAQGLADLAGRVSQAKLSLSGALRTGLSEAETRELLATRDMAQAVRLVRKGLDAELRLQALPA